MPLMSIVVLAMTLFQTLVIHSRLSRWPHMVIHSFIQQHSAYNGPSCIHPPIEPLLCADDSSANALKSDPANSRLSLVLKMQPGSMTGIAFGWCLCVERLIQLQRCLGALLGFIVERSRTMTRTACPPTSLCFLEKRLRLSRICLPRDST